MSDIVCRECGLELIPMSAPDPYEAAIEIGWEQDKESWVCPICVGKPIFFMKMFALTFVENNEQAHVLNTKLSNEEELTSEESLLAAKFLDVAILMSRSVKSAPDAFPINKDSQELVNDFLAMKFEIQNAIDTVGEGGELSEFGKDMASLSIPFVMSFSFGLLLGITMEDLDKLEF